MTQTEAEVYYETLNTKQTVRFNLLVTTALKLGKPIEGAYEYAHTIMESKP